MIIITGRSSNHRYGEPQSDERWILNDQYKDSRTKVIGKAIGDCVSKKNEFAGKKAQDIITFKNTYTPENWNAAILYNYVYAAINRKNLPKKQKTSEQDKESVYFNAVRGVKKVLGKKFTKTQKYYEEYYKDSLEVIEKSLNQAVQYIQDYADALNLDASLCDFRQSKQAYDGAHLL